MLVSSSWSSRARSSSALVDVLVAPPGTSPASSVDATTSCFGFAPSSSSKETDTSISPNSLSLSLATKPSSRQKPICGSSRPLTSPTPKRSKFERSWLVFWQTSRFFLLGSTGRVSVSVGGLWFFSNLAVPSSGTTV